MIQSTGPNSNGFVKQVMEHVSSIVSMTYGPSGGFVVLSNGEESVATKDGVSIVRVIESDDTFESAIIEIIRESALNTLTKVGDGTTSTIILANNILSRFVTSDFMRKDEIIEAVKLNIRAKSKSVDILSDEIYTVALTATAGDKELSNAIISAFRSSPDALSANVSPEIRLGDTVRHEQGDGAIFSANIIDMAFVDNTENASKSIKDAHIIVSESDVTGEEDVVGMITECVKNGIKDLVIFAPAFSISALSSLAVNHNVSCNFTPMVISSDKIISTKIVMGVIATAFGATIVGEDSGIDLGDITKDHMGIIERFSLSSKKVTISGKDSSSKEDIESKKMYLTNLMKSSTSDEEKNAYKYLLSILEKRISRVIIGGNSMASAIERKDRADDCINAIEMALNSGVVLGAGRGYTNMCLGVHCATDIDSAADDMKKLLPQDSASSSYDPTEVIVTVAEQAIELAFTLGMTKSIVIKK